jgi:hypothetical protein
MKQSAVEWLVSELKKYDSAGLKDQSNYVIELPTHILTELEEQAKQMEEEQRGYSEEHLIKVVEKFHNLQLNEFKSFLELLEFKKEEE